MLLLARRQRYQEILGSNIVNFAWGRTGPFYSGGMYEQ